MQIQIEMLSDSRETIVVSYWHGKLPKITHLHFLSFYANNDLGFKYVLFLDEPKVLDQIDDALLETLRRARIEVRYFSLEKLMSDYGVPKFSGKCKNRITQSLSFRKKRFLKKTTEILPNFLKPFLEYKEIHLHPEIGFNYDHGQKFSNLVSKPAYRSDVFRSIIAMGFPNEDVFYVDLDVCFVKKFSEYDWSNSFVSQWGTSNFANSAILFLSLRNRASRLKILNQLKRTKSAWPWNLYSERNCQEFNIEIRNIRLFDPAWTPENPLFGNSSGFFEARSDLVEQANSIFQFCLLIHWHNQWNVKPDPNSLYNHFLSLYGGKY